MLELVHITAAYSNAVLVAFLPHVSDYASRLRLPCSQPITPDQVVWAQIAPFRTNIHCALRLKDNYWFGCGPGAVVHGFRCPRIAMLDENPRENWSKYAFGKSNMTTNEAVELVRESIKGLGYSLEALHVVGPPTRIDGPYNLEGGKYHLPECKIEWNEPIDSVQAFVHLGRKQLLGLSIINKSTWRPDPKIDVVPELEKDYRDRMDKESGVKIKPAD